MNRYIIPGRGFSLILATLGGGGVIQPPHTCIGPHSAASSAYQAIVPVYNYYHNYRT